MPFQIQHHHPSPPSSPPAYAHLDTQENLNLPKKMKKRNPDLPDLEEALFEWQSLLSKSGVTVSGGMMKEEAGRLWRQLPKYHGVQEPEWSNGWLQAFKDRYRITKYKKRISTKKIMAMAAKVEPGGPS
ncbi:MAG: hypothetical protein Q9184_000016 [Pyrenodesmia sp. 2 TL-2023]